MDREKEILKYFKTRFRNHSSILYKFTTASTLTTAVFLLLAGFLSYAITRYKVTANYKDYSTSILKENTEFMNYITYSINNLSNDLSSNSDFTGLFVNYDDYNDNIGEVRSKAANMIKKSFYVSASPIFLRMPEFVQTIVFYNEDILYSGIHGGYLTSSDFEKIKQSDWYKKAYELDGKPFWTEPIYKPPFQGEDEKKIFRNVRLIKAENGEICGVLSIELRPLILAKKLAESELGKQGNIFIVNDDYVVISHINPDKIGVKLSKDYQEKIRNNENFFFYCEGENVFHVVSKSSVNDWYFIATMPSSELYSTSRILGLSVIGIMIVCLFLGFVVNGYFSYRISKPIEGIIEVTKRISSGEFEATAPESGVYEIDQLSSHFNEMQKIVNKYRKDLESLVEERTMQLVEAEKMASLGQLVAGIAHEINTPVGIGVTAATHIEKITHNFEKKFHDHTLKTIDLEKYLCNLSEAIDIISTNLHKASSLVATFKKVAVNTNNEEKKNFNIKEYLEEIAVAVLSNYSEMNYSISIECSPELIFYGYPGFFSQIITAFLINSIVHGFKNSGNGNISVNVNKKDNGDLVIQYFDDGVGIPEENVKKIFDPFFTTNRGSGNAGLGLNIVYNIINQKFKGKIKCIPCNDGAVFEFLFP